jgi:heme/copper-type cytochrome/quinol oxidase subunit 1
VGSWFIALGFLVTMYNILNTVLRPHAAVVAGDDPWDAATLEWAIPSPPPHYNFARLPTVASDRPLWDEKYSGGPPVRHEVIAGPGPHHVEMPPSSYWPILVAMAQGGLFAAFLLGRGTWLGGEFHMEPFALQIKVQLVLAAIQMFCLLAWVREDDSVR